MVEGPISLEILAHAWRTIDVRLLRGVSAGMRPKPPARLVPFRKPNRNRTLGEDKGRYRVPENFNAPLPDSLIEAFEDKS